MRIRVANAEIDTDRRQIFRNGREASLSPKAFQLLLLLLEARPKALAKDALYQALWPDTFVVEANLSNLVGEIRAALGDSGHLPRVIRTVHGFGYAFSADAAEVDGSATPVGGIRGYLLLPTGAALPLRDGENLVGREPEAQVRLDLPGVSRRHARIVIDGARAEIEDMGSKNGTFVGGEPLTGRRTLAAGDEVAFGSVRATFHSAATDASTETTERPELGRQS